MDNMEKIERLLRQKGYPEKEIPRLLQKIGILTYEKVEKLILPYHSR